MRHTVSRLALATLVFGFAAGAQAAPFTIADGDNEVGVQNLSTGEAGVIEAGGTITYAAPNGGGGTPGNPGDSATATINFIGVSGMTLDTAGGISGTGGNGGDSGGGQGGAGGQGWGVDINGSGAHLTQIGGTISGTGGDGGSSTNAVGGNGQDGRGVNIVSGGAVLQIGGTVSGTGGAGGDTDATSNVFSAGGGGFGAAIVVDHATGTDITVTGSLAAQGGAGGAGTGGQSQTGYGGAAEGINIISGTDTHIVSSGHVTATGGDGGTTDHGFGQGGWAAAFYDDGDSTGTHVTSSGTNDVTGGAAGGAAAMGWGGGWAADGRGIYLEGDNSAITASGTINVTGGAGADGDYAAAGGNAFGFYQSGDNGALTFTSGTLNVTGGDGGTGVHNNGGANAGGAVGISLYGAGYTLALSGGTVNAYGGTGGVTTGEASGTGGWVEGMDIGASFTGPVTVGTVINAFGGTGGADGGGSFGFGNGGGATGVYLSTDAIDIAFNGNITARGGDSGDLSGGGVGGDATGLIVSANNAHVTNNAVIAATGGDGYGPGTNAAGTAVFITGDGNVFTNNGTLRGVASTSNDGQGQSDALIIDGNNNTLALGAHSVIDGDVKINGTGTIVQYATGSSYPKEGGGFGTSGGAAPDFSHFIGSYTTDVVDLGGSAPAGAVIVGGNYAVTPDVFINADQSLVNDAVAQSGALIENRQRLALLGQQSGVAAGNGVNGTAWAEGFGGWRERPGFQTSAQTESRLGGVMAGFDGGANADGVRAGVYLGTFAGSNEMGQTRFRTVRSRGALAGAYAARGFGGFDLIGQIEGGYARQQSGRVVGADIAHADYDSFFITPSLTALRKIAVPGAVLVPSLSVRYTEQFTQSYSETGSAADESVEARQGGRLGARAQVSAHLAPVNGVRPAFRLGLDGDAAVGSKSVSLNVLGANVSLDAQNGSTLDGIAGVNLAYDLPGNAALYADGEADIGLNRGGADHNIGVTGKLGARWAF